MVTSFPESISVLQDYETFSSNPVRAGSHVSQSLKYVQANSALGNVERLAQLDSVAHQRLRGIVSKGFVPKTLEALRLDIRNQLAALISENVGRPERPLDVVQRLAAHIPEIVLGLQLGLVDEDREQVMTDTYAIMKNNFICSLSFFNLSKTISILFNVIGQTSGQCVNPKKIAVKGLSLIHI